MEAAGAGGTTLRPTAEPYNGRPNVARVLSSRSAACRIFLRSKKRVNLILRDPPRLAPAGDKTEFEFMIMAKRKALFSGCVHQNRQGQLRRAAAGIAPSKISRTVVAQFKVQRQRA